MIHLRIREYGSADWTSLLIQGDLEAECLQIIGSALSTSGYHAQQQGDGGEWEDLE